MQTESRSQFKAAPSDGFPQQQRHVLKPRDGPPRPGQGADENYNLLHHASGAGAYDKDIESKMQRNQIIDAGQQAAFDSRNAAQAIRNKMRHTENCISWQ